MADICKYGNITNGEILSHCNLEKDCKFYEEKFSEFSIYKLYSEMTPQEQEEFRSTIANNGYYSWLHLTDKILKDNEKIYENLSIFLQRQDFIGFISNINARLVDLHRDTKDRTHVTLDSALRTANNLYITKIEAQQLEESEMIVTYAGSPNAQKMRF